MKSFLLRIFSSILIGILLLGGGLWYFFGGYLKAIKAPSEDIAEIIEQQEKQKNPSSNDFPSPQEAPPFPLQIPENFSIGIFAKELESPRDLILDPNGNLLVSLTKAGKVVALPDKDKDLKVDQQILVVENLRLPHGLAFRCQEKNCQLYIAETHQVSVFSYDQETLQVSEGKKIVDLPADGGHYTRSLLYLTEQDELLISIGSSCNVCYEKDDRRSKVLIANPDGSNLRDYSIGLRNAVFLTQHPQTNDVWATEMGRDWLGNELPPDEINILKEGKDYGWPICYGKNIHDSNFDKNQYIQDPCGDKEASHIDLPAHIAPLGLDFFSSAWPKDFQNDLLVATHGSWNRSPAIGYKVERIQLDEEGAFISSEDFLSGWLTGNGEVLGRPVDVLINGEEREIFLSDDKAGLIYQLQFKRE